MNWTLPTKRCGRCKRELTYAHFYKDHAPGRKRGQRYCKECACIRVSECYEERKKLKQRLAVPKIRPKGFKKCHNCNQVKSFDDFHLHKKYVVQIQCKECMINRMRILAAKRKSLC